MILSEMIILAILEKNQSYLPAVDKSLKKPGKYINLINVTLENGFGKSHHSCA